MLLFEKSLVGTYCNRLYNLKESHSPFSCFGQIKQIAQAKILMSQILIRKRECYSSFHCCSHECLYCEAGAAALIDTF